jgi:hypothetical protein
MLWRRDSAQEAVTLVEPIAIMAMAQQARSATQPYHGRSDGVVKLRAFLAMLRSKRDG